MEEFRLSRGMSLDELKQLLRKLNTKEGELMEIIDEENRKRVKAIEEKKKEAEVMYINSLKESEKELHEILQMKENIAKYIGKRAQEENIINIEGSKSLRMEHDDEEDMVIISATGSRQSLTASAFALNTFPNNYDG